MEANISSYKRKENADVKHPSDDGIRSHKKKKESGRRHMSVFNFNLPAAFCSSLLCDPLSAFSPAIESLTSARLKDRKMLMLAFNC